MRKHSILLTSILLMTLSSCRNLGRLVDQKKSDSYFITSDQHILFCQSGNWFELGVDTMQADASTPSFRKIKIPFTLALISEIFNPACEILVVLNP